MENWSAKFSGPDGKLARDDGKEHREETAYALTVLEHRPGVPDAGEVQAGVRAGH